MFEWLEAADAKTKGMTVWSIFPREAMINPGSIIWISCCSSYTRQALPSTRTARTYDYGRFAWIVDPDGDRVEPWGAAQEVGRPRYGIQVPAVGYSICTTLFPP